MKIKRNIYLMYAIAFLQGMVFYAPIASLYRQARGLSLGQIALIESISFLVTLAMELPWGIVADRIGYRMTMIASCGVFFASKLVFWRACSFGMFLLERLVMSAAIAGLSGVDESVLYLSCDEESSQKVFGRYSAFGTAGVLLAAWVYTACIRDDYALSALCTAISYGLAALLALGLREVRPPEQARRAPAREFWHLLRTTVRDRRFLLLLVAVALYRETLQSATVWLNQNQYLRSGMDTQAIGWAYMAATVASMTGVFSQTVTDALGRVRSAAAVFGLAAAACMTMALTRSAALSIVCVIALKAGSGLVGPLFSRIFNGHVITADRATQLSIFALLSDTAAAGASLAYGRSADVSLDMAFWLGAAVCAFGAAVVCISHRYFEA